ncbi:MAG TPA: 50S ribosomal L9 C-terminal domain-containing protein, partial [Candidatus Paceibacterota bacterium]|nr:50S ribosomal L9 C-terminal domain-containing protein [Candidatus Paceibacterota bacterium]
KQKKLTEIDTSKENAQKVAEYLKDISINLTGKANEKGTLFDGIEPKDIAQALKDQKGVSVEAANIKLEEHIKKIGEYTIPIELTPGIVVSVKIIVSPSK